MALPLFTNFAETTIAEFFDVGDTTLVVDSASTFPTITGSDYYFLTLFDGVNAPEIVKVTSRVGTTCTVTRAQESSSSIAWDVGSRVRLAMTAAQAEEAFEDIADHETRIGALEAIVLVAISGNFLFCHGFLAN